MFHTKIITSTSRSLPPNDRRRLLDKNGDLLYQFKAAYTYSEDTVYTRTIDAISRSGEFPALEDIRQKVAGEEVRSPRLEYGQVRAPAPSLASEIFKSIFFRVFAALLVSLGGQLRGRGETPGAHTRYEGKICNFPLKSNKINNNCFFLSAGAAPMRVPRTTRRCCCWASSSSPSARTLWSWRGRIWCRRYRQGSYQRCQCSKIGSKGGFFIFGVLFDFADTPTSCSATSSQCTERGATGSE